MNISQKISNMQLSANLTPVLHSYINHHGDKSKQKHTVIRTNTDWLSFTLVSYDIWNIQGFQSYCPLHDNMMKGT